MDPGSASRTAVLVCQGRAAAHGRLAPGRFDDPVATLLLSPAELVPVEAVRGGTTPASPGERLAAESVRACSEVVVPRTVAIDDALRVAGHRQVVLVGAGLDSRPWRLDVLRHALVLSLDHPATQADLLERSAGLQAVAGRLEHVPVDLTEQGVDEVLASSPHDPALPTTWVWEGVVPYLTPAEVAATVAAMTARSAAGSVLVVNYQSPSRVAALGRRIAGLAARLSGQPNPLAGEPWRSTWSPERMSELLGRHGFSVTSDGDLLEIGGGLGSPSTHRVSLANGRVATAVRVSGS